MAASFYCFQNKRIYKIGIVSLPELKIFIGYGKIVKNLNPINAEVLRKMESYKQEFIQFMVESQVLKFGDFTLKSGRKSPFFMNAGAYVTGSQLKKLGEYYAKAIHDRYGDDFDVLFGPAYKGNPVGSCDSDRIQ